MKKTKILVMTACIVLGIGSAVYAKLPADSIVVGSNVYDAGYLENPANLATVNDQLMNNLGNIYYVGSNGKAQDIFTDSPVDDSQIVSKVGSTLTYYNASGVRQKIVADSNNEYTDPKSTNENIFAIVNVTYKTITTGLTMYTVKVPQVSGVNNAAYFKVGDSSVTPLMDTATYMGSASSSGGGMMLSIYASDGTTELANGYISLSQNSESGSFNTSIVLSATAANNPLDETIHGNTASNLTNNGFAALDSDKEWIYYENTADGGKLYKKSVTGVDNYVISDDKVQYINVAGDWVYYSNYSDDGKIYKVRTDGTQRQKVCDDMASYINVVGSKIYYINNSDRARIYVYDSSGKRQVVSDSAKYLSVGDNFLFYSNESDGDKLYSCNLLNNYSKSKLSDISTEFISAVSDYLIFYTGTDGKLYRSMGSYTNYPTPLNIITNIPQKGKESTNLNGVSDKATVICALDDNNIYYTSYTDGDKIYKLDSTGNGYKISDDSADYMNVVGDILYYMKSGKAYSISKDADGTTKGTAIVKPKLGEKVVSIYQLPTYSTDDISKFSFPDRVSAIMSDGTIRQLVVNWDKENPKIKNGVYSFTGSILGYNTKVTMTVSLDSGSINADRVTVSNEIGSKDSVTVDGTGTELQPGDVISVYTNYSDKKPVKTAVVSSNYKAVLSGLNFDPDGTTIYVTVTAKNKAEGTKIAVSCPAESPTGFSVDAQNQKIMGLKSGKIYKVYMNNENSDGTIPSLPSDYTEATADSNGTIIVNNMQEKIDDSTNKKQMLRLVVEGNADSKPSAPIEISKAIVPDYVSIDLYYGRIVGSTPGMQYSYDKTNWKDCQAGSTPISMTLSLQVYLKVKANGPVMESDVVTYGLFPIPQITGIEDGKTYSAKNFPDVSWDKDTDSIKYTAVLIKDGEDPVNIESGDDLKSKINSNGDGSYVLAVTGTKTYDGKTAENTKKIAFEVNSASPSNVDITIKEEAGTAVNSDNIDTYYEATPTWMNLGGTYSTATITMTKTASGAPGSVTYTPISNPATVAFIPGNTITQNGEYTLVVTTTSLENGAVTTSEKTFRVDSIDTAEAPDVSGVTAGQVFNEGDIVAPIITDKANCTTKATIMLNGNVTPYISGKEITVKGQYVLILDTTNNISGNTKETKIPFSIGQ